MYGPAEVSIQDPSYVPLFLHMASALAWWVHHLSLDLTKAHRSCSEHMLCRGMCLRPLLTEHKLFCCCQPDNCYLMPLPFSGLPSPYF